jgi:DNA-binding Lrp family transcriptional regulator
VQRREPASDLKLPHTCWAVYDQLDGETAIGEIADALGLSGPEVFAVVRQLQQRDLIEEPTISYSAYKTGEPEEGQVSGSEDEQSLPEMSGDGAGTVNEPASTTDEDSADESVDAIHLPTLWDWLEETTDNVKAYKNTQAFVLMEASDALESVGVGNMEDLEDLERCSDPAVIQALETAIANNVNERIPEQCYR